MSARYVEFSPAAEAARNALPAHVRHAINAAIRNAAQSARWEPGTYLSAADSPNAGRLAKRVLVGRQEWLVIYRIRNGGSLLWIEDISRVFVG